MEFKDKVFVVTGGGNGIGRQIVLQLLGLGAKVAALDISEEGLQETKQLIKSDKLSIHKIDITKKEQVEAVKEEVLKTYNQIDGIFNVAGIIQPFIKVNELSYEQIERVMNVNFYGTLYMVKAYLPLLLKNNTTSYIANVSSMGSFLPVPGQSIYGASKAAVKLMTEGLYAELKNTNVKVSIIFPGAVATNITKNSNVNMEVDTTDAPKFKMLTAEKAAKLIIEGVRKEKFRVLVGKDASIMDKLYRLNPKNAVHMITKQMESLLNK